MNSYIAVLKFSLIYSEFRTVSDKTNLAIDLPSQGTGEVILTIIGGTIFHNQLQMLSEFFPRWVEAFAYVFTECL